MKQKTLLVGTARLWTIQPLDVWEKLQAEGELYVDSNHTELFDGGSRSFQEAYDWMREQMAKRTVGYGGRYPWWAFTQRPGMRKNKRAWGRLGQKYARLELAVAQDRVLLSARGPWCDVLCYNYLPPNWGHFETWEVGFDSWRAELAAHGLARCIDADLPEPWRGRVIASWEQIFDVEQLRQDTTVQATFERLALADVLDVRIFKSRHRVYVRPSKQTP